EQNAGEQQIIHECEAFGGENAFGQTCHRLKVFNGKMHLEDIHDRSQQQLNRSTAKCRDANQLSFRRIGNQAACNVDTNGDGNELLQFSQTTKLSQHDLTEHQFAGSSTQSGGHGVKQHGEGQRDEQEVLNREFHDSNLEFGDQFGEKSCK